MQITITSETATWIKDIFNLLLVPVGGWMIKRWIKKSRELINGIITSNVNRSTDELKKHIDLQLKEHQSEDNLRFKELEKQITEISNKLAK